MKKIISFLLASLLLMSIAMAVNADYCCEKTTYGAWCQNAPEEKCDSKFDSAPTRCDATSYCKGGCCYEASEGLCMENTPQRVCDNNEGSWYDSKDCDIPQCELGCCVLDRQAAFVTLARCKKLSSFYGLESDFRLGIETELDCIALAQAADEGACVYESEAFIRTCKFTTREDCKTIQSYSNTSTPEFYKDYLCSNDDLATECGMSKETTCLDGRDEVYFVDTCGNPANIYDSSRAKDQEYWNKVVPKEESCGYEKGNSNSKSCGNCDYFLGSLCKEADKILPDYGENICIDLNCYDTSDGKDHLHGESWCSYDGNTGNGSDPVGSRHVRHICVAGEELLEPCADYRNKVCIETTTDTGEGYFTEAGCVVNRWQDCVQQEEEEDCKNTDRRDCKWVEGLSFIRSTEGATGEDGTISGLSTKGSGLCVPDVPPGLKFWEEGDAEGICSVGSAQCVVYYKEGLFGSKKPIENEECLEESWAQQMNEVCTSLGDCGAYVNWAGEKSQDGAEWKIKENKQTLSKGIMDELKRRAGV